MSELETKVIQLDTIIPHPDPETLALEIAIVGGWNMIVQKGAFKSGDLAVYIHLDSVLPIELSDYLKVTNYLVKGRVKAARLRGVPSYGLLQPLNIIEEYLGISGLQLGDELTERLKITKYEPPLQFTSNDIAKYDPEIDPLFVKYTDIVNVKDYMDHISEGEEVIITEKIHGMNDRVGLINGQYVAGSFNMRMKEDKANRTWFAMSDNVKALLSELASTYNSPQVIIFGELYGFKIQDLQYGLVNKIAFRVFDILVQGAYLDFDMVNQLCDKYNIACVPVLYRGPYHYADFQTYEGRKSVLSDKTIMEGMVIRTVKEQYRNNIRCVVKYVLDQYLLRRKGTEYK